ncbi:IS66 family insertion sequence element accessory protein TnpB [Dyadobacter chenwenxiniae]|uniref:IS66 family insertion sequence element accessory protein TnpB n=1 Tax=Dyadobacter chenwenxiniae TaxID=2906456 RepID=UPI0035B5C9A4
MICARHLTGFVVWFAQSLSDRRCGRNPTSGEVFVFLNRPRTRIKLLHWENGGFVLYYKRLEKGKFSLPKAMDGRVSLSWAELGLMVEGIQIQKSTQKTRFRL